MRLERLQVSRSGHVARVRLPGGSFAARDALELSSVAADLADDDSVHVVVVEASANDFCSGPADDLDPSVCNPAESLAALRPPVVAALRGRVESVGVEIALACDVRVATPDTVFRLADVGDGRLPCWGGTQRLPRAVGAPFATRMLLLGDPVDAQEALARGLVHEIGRAERVVETLANLGPLALEYAKEAVREGVERPMRAGLSLEGDLNHLLQSSKDRAEGIAAFLEKREPRFEGR